MKTCFRFSLLAFALLWVWCQPGMAQPVQNGFMAVTCYSDGNPSNPVVGLIDVTQAHLQAVNTNWMAPATHGPAATPWNRAHLGEVFGITFDGTGNFYVAATSVYTGGAPGGPAGSGAIYKIHKVTGAITTFVSTLAAPSGPVIGTNTIPNTGNGLGNIAWDATYNQMFATNFEDGKIYRISSAGTILSVFDPFGADGATAGPAPLGERLWGIGVNGGRIYFSRWNEDCGAPSGVSANQIYYVAQNAVGDFSGGAVLAQNVPTLPSSIHSNPVSDIAFAASGRMLLAERTMLGVNSLQPNAHASRVLEYTSGTGALTGNIFNIGIPGPSSACGSYPTIGAGSAGGVDYAYASYNASSGLPEQCDGAVWASGDVLKWSGGQLIYGFQRLPATGGNAATSVLIDADGNVTNGDKTNIGDVEVYKYCTEPDPCEDLQVSLNQIASGDCCYDITIAGVPTPSPFVSATATLTTPGTTFSSVLGPAGWSVSNTATTASWDLGGTIPSGTSTGLQFCVSSTVSPPQTVVVTLHRKDGKVCEYSFQIDCEPEDDTCLIVNHQNIKCLKRGPQGWVYEFSFDVTNYSAYSLPPLSLPASHVSVYAPWPTSVTPSSTALSPTLGYGQTSGTLTYTLTGPTIQPGDMVCIAVQLHGPKVGDLYRWSCDSVKICFELPPCKDCCDSTDIAINQNVVKQVGNVAASVSSAVTVTPKPIVKVQASVMGVSRSRIWCPNSSNVYVPVSAPTTIGALITGASISPTMPVSAGLTPPTSEVIWGTVYGGVNFNPGSVNLNLSFPGTNLGWRCQDTLTVCVRYSFTDTSCVTCDTVVYYTIPRCGRIDIADPADVDVIGVPASFSEVTMGEGVHVGEPLYSDVVEGPGLELTLANETRGRLAIAHWWPGPVVAQDKIRVIRVKVVPEPGIDITRFTSAEGGQVAEIADRMATLDLELNEGETDFFDIDFDNPSDADFFALRVRFDYVDLDDPDVERQSREYIVYGDLNGGGSIAVLEESKTNPILYKLLIDADATHSANWISPAGFRFTPPEGVRILASGPMPDSSFAEFHVLKSLSKASSVLLQVPNPEDYHKEYMVKEKNLELWLVLEGKTNVVDLDWEAMNMDGSLISQGSVELSPSSTVHDGDEFVPGASIHLLEAFPNPTDGAVTARFNLAHSENVSVAVFDLAGNEVARLFNDQRLNAGSYEYELNLKSLPSGAYYIRLTTDAGTQTKSVVRK